jgi:hypothetical protein
MKNEFKNDWNSSGEICKKQRIILEVGSLPKFWGYIKNQNYAIGCTGQTVYVYGKDGHELTKFRDIKYGYKPMFCPTKNIFIVKSTAGMVAAYSLDRFELIKKYRFSKVDGAQDDGFCFSDDGKLFYNIERHMDSLHTRISIYDTDSFELCTQLFTEEDAPRLHYIEYDEKRLTYFVIGNSHKYDRALPDYFIAELNGNKLINIRKLSDDKYFFITGVKSLELFGFTEKAKEWSALKYSGYDLSNIELNKVRLSNEFIT